jgi:hypothetical protein
MNPTSSTQRVVIREANLVKTMRAASRKNAARKDCGAIGVLDFAPCAGPSVEGKRSPSQLSNEDPTDTSFQLSSRVRNPIWRFPIRIPISGTDL